MFCLETGLWWRVEFDDDTTKRLRAHVQGRGDLCINVLKLLAMIVTAWAFTVDLNVAPQYVGENILMRGDNMSAVHWVNFCSCFFPTVDGEKKISSPHFNVFSLTSCVDLSKVRSQSSASWRVLRFPL